MEKISFNQKTIQFNLRDEVDVSIYNEIFKFREYRQTEEIIKNASGAIIDVGAHAGFFSIYAAALNPNAKVYALEPETNNFSALNDNIRLNPDFKKIKLFQTALSSKTGTEKLYLSVDSHNHSLIKTSYNNQEIPVKTINLSDFCRQQKIPKISLLKMDIEGGEYEIIKNLATTEFNLIDYIFLEAHKTESNSYQDLEKILRPAGFSVQVFPCEFDSDLKFILAHNKRK
jgi:FkbM family methyltransferase